MAKKQVNVISPWGNRIGTLVWDQQWQRGTMAYVMGYVTIEVNEETAKDLLTRLVVDQQCRLVLLP